MAIIVKCKRGTGDHEAPSINDPLIASEPMAVARGKRYLDDNYYTRKKRTLKVPHRSASVTPESWVTVTDGRLGLSEDLLKVTDYKIEITPSSVFAVMETATYEEP